METGTQQLTKGADPGVEISLGYPCCLGNHRSPYRGAAFPAESEKATSIEEEIVRDKTGGGLAGALTIPEAGGRGHGPRAALKAGKGKRRVDPEAPKGVEARTLRFLPAESNLSFQAPSKRWWAFCFVCFSF